MSTSMRYVTLVIAGIVAVFNAFAQVDTTASPSSNEIKLLSPSLEAGIGMGFVTFKESYTWNGQSVPDNQTEKWAMPQFYVGGRVPLVALSNNLSLQAVMSASFMLVLSESNAAAGPIDVPLIIMARYGHGSTTNSTSAIGVGVGAGASFMWWDAFGIADVVPTLYADFTVKDFPIYIRSSVNLGSIAFSTYDTVSLWSMSLNWRGVIPKWEKKRI